MNEAEYTWRWRGVEQTERFQLKTDEAKPPPSGERGRWEQEAAWATASRVKIKNAPGSGRIKRANLDGSNVETLLSNLPLPEDVSLDILGGKLYWTDGIADTINSADLDGSGPQVILSAVNGLELSVNVPIPEPAGASMLLVALAGLVTRRRG